MADVLKGLVTAAGAFVLSWVFPAAIGLSLIWSTVERVGGPLPVLGTLSPAEQAIALAGIASAVGLVLSGLSTHLYRVLEGYLWPASARSWGRQRQVRRRKRLEEEAKNASAATDRAFLMEELQRFPADPDDVAPTKLGNAFRAFETYGYDRFQLDSQSFWSELVAVAPESLRKELTAARASVDFFVALYYSSLAVGVVALVGAFVVPTPPDFWLIGIGTAALVSLQLWYVSAVASSTYWDSTVRALVNLGRKPLAEALNLQLPSTIDQEREMWSVVGAYFYYSFDKVWASRLDEFRKLDVADTGHDNTTRQATATATAAATEE